MLPVPRPFLPAPAAPIHVTIYRIKQRSGTRKIGYRYSPTVLSASLVGIPRRKIPIPLFPLFPDPHHTPLQLGKIYGPSLAVLITNVVFYYNATIYFQITSASRIASSGTFHLSHSFVRSFRSFVRLSAVRIWPQVFCILNLEFIVGWGIGDLNVNACECRLLGTFSLTTVTLRCKIALKQAAKVQAGGSS